jgi:rhodanese-related sulfurtransferase
VKRTLYIAVKEGIIIALISVVVSLAVNFARDDGIPLIADADAFRIQTNAEFLKVEDAGSLFDQGKAVFIDARAPEIYDRRHIEGAMNVTPTDTDLESLMWLTGADIHVVCYADEASQRQAGVVADRLLDMGCEKVFVLNGGIEAWIALGLPVEEEGV